MRAGLLILTVAVAALSLGASPAAALILPPKTLAGPGDGVVELGGAAIASDGTGGVVYTKDIAGVPHVFVARYDGHGWSAPIRVDWDRSLAASQPRIAAGPGGRLLVVWVTPVATFEGHPRDGLFSASLGPGTDEFQSPLLVDGNVGEGQGVDPSLAGTTPGKAIVAYRVVTSTFATGGGGSGGSLVQLRPGDVFAQVRAARLAGNSWSHLGVLNRNPAASMRPPSEENGPQAGIGASGNAVVAWQEPDQSGTARIWVRRIYGSTPGPAYEASPASWEGQPISADADAFSLAVTSYDGAWLAMRLGGGPGLTPSGQRLFLNMLPPAAQEGAGKPAGATAVEGAPAAGLGAPSVAADAEGGGDGAIRLAFTASGTLHQFGLRPGGKLTALPSPGVAAAPGAQPLDAVTGAGDGLLAWPAPLDGGREALAVREDFASGALQTALLSGAEGGPLSQPRIGEAEGGEALLAFCQGEPGRLEVMADRVTEPPASFAVSTPQGWVRPSQARLSWSAPLSGVGGLSYSVLLNGQAVAHGLTRRSLTPPPALLGNGVEQARVLATDSLGGQLFSAPVKLRVDSQPPRVKLRLFGLKVRLEFSDGQSGLDAHATRCLFGDGTSEHGGSYCAHAYARLGHYTILVHASDRAGNAETRRLKVRVR